MRPHRHIHRFSDALKLPDFPVVKHEEPKSKMSRNTRDVLVIGGVGVAFAGGVGVLYLYESLSTGTAFDSFRFPIMYGVLRAWPLSPSLTKMRTLMLIAMNENSVGQVGDNDATVGPSIGPWQVSRGLATTLGLWTPFGDPGSADDRSAYASLALDDYTAAYWGALAFKSKLDVTGDINSAIVAYNGSGPKALAYLNGGGTSPGVLPTAATLGWTEFTS